MSTTAWVPSTADFATRLAMVRQRMGWNLKEAAVECDLGVNDWARWEGGMMPRNFTEAVMHISARTGVDMFWLMTGQAPVIATAESRPSDYKSPLPAKTRPANRRDRRTHPTNRNR